MLYSMIKKLSETETGTWLLSKLNAFCDMIPPPITENPTPRNILVISAHPRHDCLNGALLTATRLYLLNTNSSRHNHSKNKKDILLPPLHIEQNWIRRRRAWYQSKAIVFRCWSSRGELCGGYVSPFTSTARVKNIHRQAGAEKTCCSGQWSRWAPCTRARTEPSSRGRGGDSRFTMVW